MQTGRHQTARSALVRHTTDRPALAPLPPLTHPHPHGLSCHLSRSSLARFASSSLCLVSVSIHHISMAHGAPRLARCFRDASPAPSSLSKGQHVHCYARKARLHMRTQARLQAGKPRRQARLPPPSVRLSPGCLFSGACACSSVLPSPPPSVITSPSGRQTRRPAATRRRAAGCPSLRGTSSTSRANRYASGGWQCRDRCRRPGLGSRGSGRRR